MEIYNESIFTSSIRSFFKAFAAILGLFFAFLPLFLIFLAFTPTYEPCQKNNSVILPDAKGKCETLPDTAPVILRVNINGVIGEDYLTAENIDSILLDSQRGVFKKNRIKALLLYLNTPGGGVTDSDTIYRLLVAYKKKYKVPVYAYVDGICASGGMYVASAADKIYSSPVSILGSIGVIIGPFFNVIEGLNKIGIKSLTLTEGSDKDMMNPFRPWKEGDEKCLKTIGAYLYERFVTIFTQNRPVNKSKLINEYGAQVFDAKKAKEIGFIDDDNSSYEETLQNLVKAAKIPEKTAYQVVEIRPKKSWIIDIIKEKFPSLKFLQKERKDYFSYLYEPI